MLKSIIAVQLLMLYWFGSSPIDPNTLNGVKPIKNSTNALNLSLDCITDTVIVYIPDPAGVTICADDLINGIDTMIGCTTITFTLEDEFGNIQTCFDFGVNEVFPPAFVLTVTAMDNCGNIATCDVNVDVVDSMMPNIICPLPDTVCEFNQAAIPYTFNTFLTDGGQFTDNTFDPMVPIPQSFFSYLGQDTLVDGCNFLLQRSYRIEDYAGLADTCIHTIAVQDTVDVRCPSSITVETPSNTCSALVIPDYVIASNCEIDTIFNDTSNDSIFPATAFAYDVEYTFITVCGDTSTCIIEFNVYDTVAPTLRCPVDISIECEDTTLASSLSDFILLGGVAEDNCGLDPLTFQHIDSIADNNACDTIFRLYGVADIFGTYAECTQVITVTDEEKPMLDCPANVTINTDAGECYAILVVVQPVVSDNCGIDTLYHLYSNTPTDTFPVGNNNVIWIAFDNCGNFDTCHMLITIEDNEDPVASDVEIEVDCSFSEVDKWETITDYTNDGGIVSDNCAGNLTITYQDSILVPLDTLIRIYDIEDASGNAVEVHQVIIITDSEPPLVFAPMDVTITCLEDKDDTNITGIAAVDDDCFGPIDTSYVDTPLSGPCPRIYRRIWTAVDEAGNAAQDTQIITQTDLIPPSFAVRADELAPINCNGTLPPHQTIAAMDECTGPATVVKDTLPYVINNCTGYSITYVWTAYDQCGNSAQQFESFDVLPDVTKPTIADPADRTVNTDDGLCTANLVQNNPATTDNCSAITVTKSPVSNVYNKGLTVVTWTATDACGNTATVQQNITVVDNESPELTCKGLRTLDLSYGINQLPASNFVQSATDNCPGDLIIKARRMDTTCSPTGNVLGDNVIFCCEDANDTILVVVRVTDAAGNTAECMTSMIIKDKLAPIVEEPLRNIEVSCDYFIDLSDLTAFGTIVFNQNDRDTIHIDDDHFETLPGDFLDGWVTDNCLTGLTLNELPPLDQRDPHNRGNIIRRFVVTDASGNTKTLQQIITVIDTDPLTEGDIDFPADINITDCTNIPPDTSVTGSPIIHFDDICTIPAATYKDQIFDDPTSGCILIRRKWTVIDWGQYIANTGIGVWTHIQNIHLINAVPPVFVSSCANRTLCAVNAECDAVVRLGAHGDDDCTDTEDLHYDYKVDVLSDGSINHSAVSDTFGIRMPRGVHTITWRVEDKCGNISTCSYTVQVKECKAPSPVCMNGLSTNLVNEGVSVIWATDFNIGSSDNCTPQNQLKFSFSSNVNETSKTLTCADADKDVPISMWVTDLDGNQSKCNTYIKVTDLHNLCPDTLPNNTALTVTIAGRIATEENTLIANADIVLTNGNNQSTIATDATGNFLFKDLGMYADYEVIPNNNKDWLNGVSTLDLVMIQRHILAIKKLDSPYKLIAADANGDKKITASDLVELRKLILGVNKEIQSNKSYRFVDKSFTFPDVSIPWPFKESLTYSDLDVNMMSSDFVAVKIGDINGSLQVNDNNIVAENRAAKELTLQINDEYFEANKYVNIPVSASGMSDISALQLNFKLDKNSVKFQGIMSEGLDISKDNYFYNEETGMLTIAYYNETKTELSQNTILFTLQLSTLDKNKLANAIAVTNAHISNEAYNSNDEKYEAVLRYSDNMEALSVSQNTPNPFSDQTEVKFFIYDDALVEVSIFDNSGAKVYNSVKSFKGGMNKLTIGKEELGDARGVFYLHISTGERNEIKKMIRIN